MNLSDETLLIFTTRGISVIDIHSIVRVEAISNYSKLYLNDGRTILVSKVLRLVEKMLEDKGFARVHRSHLVNKACIREYDLYHLKIVLHNKEEIRMSRRKSTTIRRVLFAQQSVYLRKKDKIIPAPAEWVRPAC